MIAAFNDPCTEDLVADFDQYSADVALTWIRLVWLCGCH